MADGFRFADGSVAHDVKELLDILEEKDTGLTEPHVARNDYANWVRHVLEDETLARRLEKCRTVQQVIDVLRLESTPKPQYEQEAEQPEPEPQPEPAVEPSPAPKEEPAKREPIRDLKPADHELHRTAPTPPDHQRAQPQRPEPVPKQSLLDRYNAREFLLGFVAGIILTVLVFGILQSL